MMMTTQLPEERVLVPQVASNTGSSSMDWDMIPGAPVAADTVARAVADMGWEDIGYSSAAVGTRKVVVRFPTHMDSSKAAAAQICNCTMMRTRKGSTAVARKDLTNMDWTTMVRKGSTEEEGMGFESKNSTTNCTMAKSTARTNRATAKNTVTNYSDCRWVAANRKPSGPTRRAYSNQCSRPCASGRSFCPKAAGTCQT